MGLYTYVNYTFQIFFLVENNEIERNSTIY